VPDPKFKILNECVTHERVIMVCLCQQIAGDDIELSPTGIGNRWIFEKFAPEDVQALAKKALRKKMKNPISKEI
jgi:hypothetical protein